MRCELLGAEQIFALGAGHGTASLPIGQHRDPAHDGGAYRDRVMSPPDRRVEGTIDPRAVAIADRGKGREIRDRVVRTGRVFGFFKSSLRHPMQSIDLTAVALDRVRNLFKGVGSEVAVLAEHRPDPARLEHPPLQAGVTPLRIGGKEAPDLFRPNRSRSPPIRRARSAGPPGKAQLRERDLHLVPVRGRPAPSLDHQASPSSLISGIGPSRRETQAPPAPSHYSAALAFPAIEPDFRDGPMCPSAIAAHTHLGRPSGGNGPGEMTRGGA